MNISRPFIRRPIGTTLLSVGILLTGLVAYHFLPVASMPTVEFPTIRVTATQPGADPATMAATVAAPLERRLGEIAGVTEISSYSSLGSTSISIQFDVGRSIDRAARDVQAAINAATSDLPSDLPTQPILRKVNPSASPILILALSSDSIPPSVIYDAADTVLVQRISQVSGVGEVTASGAEQPAIRVRVNPALLASMGVSMEDVRLVIAAANARGAVGAIDGPAQAQIIETNEQMRVPSAYSDLVVKTSNGAIVRLSSIASIEQGTLNTRSAASFNGGPSVLLVITRQADANVIETVDRIRALLPELQRWIPADIKISVLSDRTLTIRASVAEMQLTLVGTIVLVMLVVFVFLRRTAATLAAGVTVPLSLAGTCAVMWLLGFSLNNLTLMALAISVGFVVDDAIVMIENTFRNLEAGKSPLRAALEGARQIGFTVVSISVSLIAAFIPLLFMGDFVGRLLREFSVTLAVAVAISTVVSLTLTPMICAHFVRQGPSPDATWFDRAVESVLSRMIAFYGRTLTVVLRHRVLPMLAMAVTIAFTVYLYRETPKGYFPQDDSGLLIGSTRASPEISFQAMEALQRRIVDIVLADPAVAAVGSTVGGSRGGGGVNSGRMFISLKPPTERRETSQQIIARLRPKLLLVGGMQLFMFPAQDVRVGGRSSRSQYQFTLWSPNIDDIQTWAPRVQDRLQRVPGIADVNVDREQGGLQATVVIDRNAASRLGVRIRSIDDALNNAFSQRQVSRIYTQRNQYRVILEVDPQFQRDPGDLEQIYVPGAGGVQVPLSSIMRIERTLAPLVVYHQGQFPSATISYNLEPNVPLLQASTAILQAVAELHLPNSLRTEFSGEAQAAGRTANTQPLLILAALIAVYIVLGVLYESLAHPLTIISTLPSAGLGALLALQATNTELSIIAFIGIILLIGIVKKNGIMLVDFALEAERKRGMSPVDAIYAACLERFRPILMTTLAALLGAVPLVIASGPGSELRRPLGITIIGGLLVSQVLTLYTTPVIYLLLDRLHRRLWGTGAQQPRLMRKLAGA